jgi:hypothetical protein
VPLQFKSKLPREVHMTRTENNRKAPRWRSVKAVGSAVSLFGVLISYGVLIGDGDFIRDRLVSWGILITD